MRLPAYQLTCKNKEGGQHRIKLPLPKDVTLGTHKPAREGLQVDLACPRCKQVHRYTGNEVVHSFEEIVDLRKLPPDPVPVRIEVACAHPNCNARAVLYTVRAPDEEGRASLERVHGSAVFVDCAAGHPLVLPDIARWRVTDGPNCNPF